MKLYWRMLLVLLSLVLVLAGCAGEPAEETAPEVATEAAAPVETVPPTQAPTEPEETLPPAVLPEEDAATGTLMFYFGDKAVHAGGMVSDILDLGIQTYQDLEQIVQPGHLSDVIRVRVEDEALAEKDRPFLFFVAANGTEEAMELSQCSVYALAVNTDQGVAFGSGKESTPFVTGQTTMDEMIAAYGEPDHMDGRKSYYREIAYYEPFNSVYFTFRNGKVRQIFTCYGANLFEEQAAEFNQELKGYFGNDCYILMNQYLDVKPYLNQTKETASLKSFCESVKLGEDTVELGKQVSELPETFREPLQGLKVPLGSKSYVTVGRNNPEEFWLINSVGSYGQLADGLTVKGVITKNCNYRNWGTDNSLFHTFEYDGLTQDATIEEILEKYGMPDSLDCTSTSRACYAWMEYQDEAGNYVHFCVDPMVNQIVEVHINKFFPKERHA